MKLMKKDKNLEIYMRLNQMEVIKLMQNTSLKTIVELQTVMQ